MLEETPAALHGTDGNELLIEGIVIQLSLTETPDSYSVSEGEDDYYELCFVRLEGQAEPQQIRLYSHCVGEATDQESSGDDEFPQEEEFLLVSREPVGTGQMVYNGLLRIDQDGDVAHRVGVASLRLENVELLDNCKPERRLFKLR